MVIDSHCHVMLPVNKHIEIMDEAGVDKTILFYTSIHPELATNVTEFEQEIGKLFKIISGEVNGADARKKGISQQVEAIRLYPDRFLGFGSVPNGLSYEEACHWIEKEVVARGFLGLGEFTLPSGHIPQLEPIFQSSSEYGCLPLWVHTFEPLKSEDILELAELAKKYPQIPVIFGHLGGIHWLDTIKLAKDISNAYLDVSAFFTTTALSLAMEELPTRTLFSSDCPYGDPFIVRTAIDRHAKSSEVRDRVLGGNIIEMLHI
jgi:uncharacterized protein